MYVSVFRADYLGLNIGGSSLEKIESNSLSSHRLTVSIHLKVGALWNFPHPYWHVNWYFAYTDFVQIPHCWDLWIQLPIYYWKKLSFIRILIFWLLQSFHALFCNLLWALGIEVCCKYSNWSWAHHDNVFSAFWPVVDFYIDSIW